MLEQLRIKVEKQQKKKLVAIRKETLVGETIQITVHGSANFIITIDMLFINEETTQKALKYIKTFDFLMPKIPTKALYKLQVRVT